MTQKFQELVDKLKEIFQLDKPELDFGVYRIMHTRAKEVTEFLEKRLAEKVRAALAGNAAAERTALENELAAAIKNAHDLGADPEMLPKVRELKDKIAALGGDDDAEASVYSHLLAFFSRYYDNGDFISKRRYKEGVYAIPYSGEEVKLHWANADQYYIKSGENFQNYDFSLDGGAKVHFKLVTAETAKDNIKDNEAVRCFVLWDPANKANIEDEELADSLPDKILEEKNGELYIYFQYLKFKKGTKQGDFTRQAVEKIAQELGGELLAKYPIFALAPTEKDKKRTVLEKHFTTYTEKNTSDYFIHKDLGGFLRRELDFYIKNEMMHLDDIQNIGAFKEIEKNLRQIQAVRIIAGELITFMAQLEDFQKKLWLKKKFVTQCDYCLTMDLVPEELRQEVLANKRQQTEWKRLGVDADPKASDMMAVDARMVDTKFFVQSDGSNPFKDKLLKEIDGLDDQCDGLLIHSENFGALKLLGERYQEKIKSIFIDPPYNTGEGDFLYKDNYQSSSWLSMLNDRLRASYPMLSESGFLGCHMDEHEHKTLEFLLSSVFGDGNLGPLIWDKRNPKGDVAGLAAQHEYVHFAAKSKKWLSGHEDAFVRDKEHAEIMLRKAASLIKKAKGVTDKVREEFAEWLKAQDFSGGEKAYQFIDDNGDLYQSVSMAWPNKKKAPDEYFIPLKHPVTGQDCPVPARGWRNPPITMKQLLDAGLILFGADEKTQPRRKYLLKENMTDMLPSVYGMGSSDDSLFKDLDLVFDNPKTVKGSCYFLKPMVRPMNSSILDYFGGSGTTAHAVIALNREDGGKRKYILVEMGDHFDTVLKPRIEKVVYSPDWKDGKPVSNNKGISHCFKYLTLESYEDALNNIELENKGDLLAGAVKDEYLLGYMLDVESKGSIINTDDFRHPFDYRLKIAADSSGASEKRKIDLIETFNYLIGLRVAQYVREIAKGYAFLDGTLPNGEKAFVMWRDCDKVNDEELNKLLAKFSIKPGTTEYDVIYVNGDHAIANVSLGENAAGKVLKVRQIENEFLDKMFAETK